MPQSGRLLDFRHHCAIFSLPEARKSGCEMTPFLRKLLGLNWLIVA